MAVTLRGVGRDQEDEFRRLDEFVPLVASLHAASWKSAYRGIFPQAWLDAEVESERLRHWRQRVHELAAGTGEIFLASVAHRPAGFLCIEVGVEKEWGALVDALHVLPSLRGKRIGGSLLAHAEEWALHRGQRQMYLWVFEENHAARRFYRREGWRDAERQLQEVPGGERRAIWRVIKRP